MSASALRQLEKDVKNLCDAVDHVMEAHHAKGPCFENMQNAARVARQSLILYVQRN